MQTMLDAPTTSAPAVSEADAQAAAAAYLADALGAEYSARDGFYGEGRWYFRICAPCADREHPPGVGKIAVDATTGTVLALTQEQIRDMREAAAVQAAHAHGEMARDEHGYVLRYQAQLGATEWLRDHLGMHFSATDGLLIPLGRPLWQFSIRFRLSRVGEIKPLGVIDVDAMTGRVTPLGRQQTQTIQERVRALIRHRELAPAT